MVFTSCIFIPTMKAYQLIGVTYRDTRVVAFINRAAANEKASVKSKAGEKVVHKYHKKPAARSNLTKEDHGRLLRDMSVNEIRRMFTEVSKKLA